MNIKAGMNSYPKISCTRTVERRGNKIHTRIEMRNADGTSAGSIGITESVKAKPKKLSYNFKKISTQIMQSKTSSGASRVLIRARAQVALLKGKLRSGEYDDQELQNAITHGEAIARVAKKRMKHLREEENAKQQGGPCEAEWEDGQENEEIEQLVAGGDTEDAEKDREEGLQKLKEEFRRLEREYQKLMRESQRDLEKEMQEAEEMEEFSEAISHAEGDDMDPADLELMKKKHRAKELREIMEADMKYLKAMFDKLAKEKQEGTSGGSGSIGDNGYGSAGDSGVALELGGADIPIQAPVVDAAALVEGGIIDASV